MRLLNGLWAAGVFLVAGVAGILLGGPFNVGFGVLSLGLAVTLLLYLSKLVAKQRTTKKESSPRW